MLIHVEISAVVQEVIYWHLCQTEEAPKLCNTKVVYKLLLLFMFVCLFVYLRLNAQNT